jgi:hypothetical protein
MTNEVREVVPANAQRPNAAHRQNRAEPDAAILQRYNFCMRGRLFMIAANAGLACLSFAMAHAVRDADPESVSFYNKIGFIMSAAAVALAVRAATVRDEI